MMKHNLKFLVIFILSAILLSSCSALKVQSTPESTPIPTVESSGSVISQGNLVPKQYMYLSFPAGGHISQVMVSQGDKVTAGQVLATMGDREQYQANVTAAQLEVENAQQALDNLNKNADITSSNAWLKLLDANEQLIQAEIAWSAIDTDEYQKKIDDANIEVADKKTALDDAQTEYDKYANLEADNPTRMNAEDDLKKAQDEYDAAVHARDQLVIDRDRAQANLQMAQAMQVKAQSDYDTTRQGPDPDQLKLAQMNLDTAQTHLDAAQLAVDNLDLKAPFDGTVVDVNVDPDQLVSTGTWAVLLADYSEWYVETNDLTEQEVVKISVGQSASLAPDALPDLKFTGKVTEIADGFIVQSGDVLYKVRLLVDNPDPQFRWGMTTEVTFAP
jgi:multidrug efflux pump subunit AcrA (membrane-fusion protein)